MSTETQNQRDLVLAPNQYAFIQDETKGGISVAVGPYKMSLAGTDRLVSYNPATRKYDRTQIEGTIKEFPLAAEGGYIVLENPSTDENSPQQGTLNSQAKLKYGSKVNVPGPVMFPLWPGQAAQVIDGHQLRSNQYLLVRVYNEEAARQNWTKSVMKPVLNGEQTAQETKQAAPPDLTIGKLIVIKGTEVSFYIPPTGVEVVADDSRKYVREAVTLERLEYCILLDESGTKTIQKGPAVVFPKPTEVFVHKEGERRFRAIELNDDMGIYIKVIADYEDGKTQFKTGEELFITGKDQRIYYPREEHAIIRYGERERHFGIAVPEGEARYVLNKLEGSIKLVRGPMILLPDPRKEVIVRRVLDDTQVQLLFPSNAEARQHNAKLRDEVRSSGGKIPELLLKEKSISASAIRYSLASPSTDEFQRNPSYTPPRTVTLDTKYEGAVSVNVWSGFAMQIINKTGGRRVAVGPTTVLFEYDESPQVLELSTGKPKNTDHLLRTAFLRVQSNYVTDYVNVVTKDMVEVEARLSYRVDFEGESEKWFTVENYVKYLCDHVRSVLKHTVKQVNIEDFNNNSVPIIRDAILGAKPAGAKRPGMQFENGMRVYDVDVLGIKIGDDQIRELLMSAQHQSVRQTLEIHSAQKHLELVEKKCQIDSKVSELNTQMKIRKSELERTEVDAQLQLVLTKAAADLHTVEERHKLELVREAQNTEISNSVRVREKADADSEYAIAEARQAQTIALIKAEVQATVDKLHAASPELMAALQTFADKSLTTEAMKSMAPLAILGGKSVMDVLKQLLEGSAFAKALPNGHNTKTSALSASTES